jgi:hypothetical protein
MIANILKSTLGFKRRLVNKDRHREGSNSLNSPNGGETIRVAIGISLPCSRKVFIFTSNSYPFSAL